MTTITIKNSQKKFAKTSFNDAYELLEFLNESFGVKMSWSVADEDVSEADKKLIKESKNTSWDELTNI